MNELKNENGKYYIIRGDHSGVFFAQISHRDGREVTLANARRLWRWSGATECIQLAKDGVNRPDDCKFTVTIDELVVLDAIELIPCTQKSVESIKAVPEWTL